MSTSVNLSRPMSRIADETLVNTLTIPGSHDTMTSGCSAPYYRTQSLTLQEQLECGVRFLDIRLTKEMLAAHREWISDIDVEHIFEDIRRFLDDNPSEFLMVRIQNANERKDDFTEYAEALLPHIRTHRSLFWSPSPTGNGSVWPTVGDLRGKILAFECSPREFGLTDLDGETWAVPWHDNPDISLQDLWDGPPVDVKIREILRHHESDAHGERLVLNHVSATNGVPGNPANYAQEINPAVLSSLGSLSGRGVLIFDFVDAEITRRTWDSNVAQ